MERTIVIGDIHGCDSALKGLLEVLQPGEEDRLILLGDLFDRGGESWEVFRTVKALAERFGGRFTLLRGNHEDYLLKEKLTFREKWVWEKVGRSATVASFKAHGERMEDAAPWIREHCRLFYRDGDIQCVHAGLMVDPIEANDMQTLIHDHGIVMQNGYAGPLTVVGHIALKEPAYFAGDRETVEEIPYGEWRPLPENGVLCIDTGCGKGGRLTAMVVSRRTEGRFFCLVHPMSGWVPS